MSPNPAAVLYGEKRMGYSDSPAGMKLECREKCPVCSSSPSTVLFSGAFDRDPIRQYLLDFYGGKFDPAILAEQRYDLLLCEICTLVYQRWVPDRSSLQYLYGRLAVADPQGTSATRGLDVRLGYLHTIERVVRYFGGNSSEVKVLDFGSGTGLWLQMAAALGCHTSAAELDPEVLSRLLESGHEAFNADEIRLNEFHLINTEQVFEHLTNPRETALQLRDALLPGGLLRISVPNGANIGSRLDHGDWAAPKGSTNSLNPVAPLEHLNCFNHESLTRLGEEVGLVPFVFPLATEIHSTARIRYIASAVAHRVLAPRGTMLYFQRPY